MNQLFCDFRFASMGALEELEPVCGPAAGTISASLGLKMGPTLFGFVRGNQGNVTGQMAAKFSIDSFIDAATAAVSSQGDRVDDSEVVVQQGLREANRRVFEYSAKMLAASRVTNTGLLSVFDGVHCTVARTGDEEAYLWRSGELTPLFRVEGELSRTQRLERFIGANKHLLADIATFKVRTGDIIWITNVPLPSLRSVSDVPFDELSTEALAVELALRMRSSAPRGERVMCGVFLFDQPPILLKQIVN